MSDTFVPCPRCRTGTTNPVGHRDKCSASVTLTPRLQRNRIRRRHRTWRSRAQQIFCRSAYQTIDRLFEQDVSHVGKMDNRCPHCGTCLFKRELSQGSKYGKFSQCCENGAVMLSQFRAPPRVILLFLFLLLFLLFLLLLLDVSH